MKELLQFISEGSSVERYHTRPGIKPDTDGRHSHGVLMLASLLAGTNGNGMTRASAALLMACATHDLAEQWASDVSAGAKRAVPGLRELVGGAERGKLAEWGLDYHARLSDEEDVILRLADQFDCLLWCTRELALGNRNAMLVWRRTCAAVESLAVDTVSFDLSLRASQVYEAIKEICQEATGPTGPNFDVYLAVGSPPWLA